MSSQEQKAGDIHSGTSSSVADGAMSSKARERAIAALPELIDAARNVLELDRDTFPNYVRGTFAELRRVLARIEEGE